MAWTQFRDKVTALADMQSPSMIEVVWLELFSFTFLWLLRTEGVTKAFSHRSHLYFLWPSCTTWMWTLSVSFLLKVASHWSHLNVLSPVAKTDEHLWEPFPVIYCCAFEHTVITHSKRGTNFTGAIVWAEKYKEGCFIAPDNPKQWSLESSGSVFFNLFFYRSLYCVSIADIPGDTVKQTVLPYVSSERQVVLYKTCLILLIIPWKSTKTPDRQTVR